MKKSIKWGVIGCGSVVQTKSGPAFNNVKNSSIEAIMRRNISDAKESAALFNAPNYYDKVEDLLLDKDINAIYIATPPGLHYEQALLCAKAKKPTYIEKPVARNYNEVLKIVEAFKGTNTPLFIAHYRRELPLFKRIKELLNNDIIGEIVEADVRLSRIYYPEDENKWLYKPEISGGGRFVDIAPHTIDILVFLLGEFEEVKGYAMNKIPSHEVEDIVTFSFKTKKGILGSANFNLCSNKKEDFVTIYGTKGNICFQVHGNSFSIHYDDGKSMKEEFDLPIYIQEPMIESITKYLLDDKEALYDEEGIIETYRIIDIILNDYYNGREDNFWMRPNTWNK